MSGPWDSEAPKLQSFGLGTEILSEGALCTRLSAQAIPKRTHNTLTPSVYCVLQHVSTSD